MNAKKEVHIQPTTPFGVSASLRKIAPTPTGFTEYVQEEGDMKCL